MKKLLIGVSIVASMAIVGCEDPNEGELFVQPTNIESEMSVTTILEKSPETYSLWIELLNHANFYNALKDANANVTVFCPDNEAMQEFLRERELNSVTELDFDYARTLVKNHIIDWQDQGNSLTDSALILLARGNEYIQTQNLFNKYLTLSYGYTKTDVDDAERTDEVFSPDSIFFNNQAKLARFLGTTCANGSIYTMADVIVPNAENILERLELQDGHNHTFRIFADAIRADAEMHQLATLERDTTIGEGGVHVVKAYYYTCFAVPDHIMNEAGITDVPSLKTWLVNNSNGEETDGDEALNHYLKYHFMPTQYTISEIFNFTDPSETLIYDTKYTGQAFIVNQDGNTRIINKEIPVLRSDIEASNGLINKVGGVMPVYHPEPVNVKWDFLNSADIISWVNKWSTDMMLGNIFTSPLGNVARQIDLSEEHYDGENGTITSFVGEYNDAKASTRSYRRVGFMKEKHAVGKPDVAEHGAFMNNYMVLNLGFAGWVEFTTPTIIAGKYKVVLHYVKDPQLMKLFSAGTMVQFNIDGDANQTLAYLYRGLGVMPLYSVIEEPLWGEVVFENSSTHTFRIMTRDIQAKTESFYHLRLDYVEFIPIEE